MTNPELIAHFFFTFDSYEIVLGYFSAPCLPIRKQIRIDARGTSENLNKSKKGGRVTVRDLKEVVETFELLT